MHSSWQEVEYRSVFKTCCQCWRARELQDDSVGWVQRGTWFYLCPSRYIPLALIWGPLVWTVTVIHLMWFSLRILGWNTKTLVWPPQSQSFSHSPQKVACHFWEPLRMGHQSPSPWEPDKHLTPTPGINHMSWCSSFRKEGSYNPSVIIKKLTQEPCFIAGEMRLFCPLRSTHLPPLTGESSYETTSGWCLSKPKVGNSSQSAKEPVHHTQEAVTALLLVGGWTSLIYLSLWTWYQKKWGTLPIN